MNGVEVDTQRIVLGPTGKRREVWLARPISPERTPVLIYNHGSRARDDGTIDHSRPTYGHDTEPWPGVAAGRWATVFPDGRGYGGSDGPKLGETENWEQVIDFLAGRADDCNAAFDWVIDQDWVDPDRIAVCGCSHGGIVSLMACAKRNYRAAILQAPGFGALLPEEGKSAIAAAVSASRTPLLLQHAEHDLRAPIEHSETIVGEARSSGRACRFTRYPMVRGMDSHSQFDFSNRHIWSREFNDFLSQETDYRFSLL